MLLFLSLFVQDTFAIPQTFSQQGRLMDNTGIPLNGVHNLTFRIFESPSSSTELWSEVLSVLFDNGYYNVVLGSDSNNALDNSVFDQSPLYLEIQLNNDFPFQPRQKMHSHIYAQVAKKAHSVEGGDVNATQIQVGGVVVIDSDGSWVGPTINLNWNDLQGIPADFADGVDNDTILSESEVENYVTNGALDLAEGTTIGGNVLQEAISCQEGQILRWDGSLGWGCSEDSVLNSDDVLGYVTQNPIDLADNSTVAGKEIVSQNAPCNDGQILVYDFSSSSWSCGEDKDTNTQLTADQIVTLLTDRALQLANGTTVNGSPILTENSSLDWNQISNVPSELADGDDKGIDLVCNAGDTVTYDGSAWTCSPFEAALDADGDDVLAWNDCDDKNASLGSIDLDADCDGTLTVDDCDDQDASSTTLFIDADCDTILTDDDCNDNDALSTIKSEDADCDTFLTDDDCDDENSDITTSGTGENADCAAGSCQEILLNGYSKGDAVYSIKPKNTAFEVFCDMTTDGGGWNVIWRTEGSLSITQYDELTESIWIQNGTEFLWHVINPDGSTEAEVHTKFNNTYEHWKANHTGGDGGTLSTAPTPDLEASWSVSVPSLGVNIQPTGIVRAVPFKDVAYSENAYGLHYKRTSSGEHYPWFDVNGVMSSEGYLCNDATACGYDYGTISGKTHVIAVR